MKFKFIEAATLKELKPCASKIWKGATKKMDCIKKFKKGQYVRVVWRKKHYIGTYYRYEEVSDGEHMHVVQFVNEVCYIDSDKKIFPVEGL